MHINRLGQSENRACQKDLCKYNNGMNGQKGRPFRDPEAGATKIVPIRMTDAEKNTFNKAAKQAKVTLSEWIRDRLARVAKRELK